MSPTANFCAVFPHLTAHTDSRPSANVRLVKQRDQQKFAEGAIKTPKTKRKMEKQACVTDNLACLLFLCARFAENLADAPAVA